MHKVVVFILSCRDSKKQSSDTCWWWAAVKKDLHWTIPEVMVLFILSYIDVLFTSEQAYKSNWNAEEDEI